MGRANGPSVPGLAGVVLAAGFGTRLRPLTDVRPKALCPVNHVPLVDLAIARIRRHTTDVAVNVHHHADQMREHLSGRVHLSVEAEHPLGSGGALGHLRDWVDGRPVLVHNVDALLDDDLDGLVAGWDGRRPRLLVRTGDAEADFGRARYVGACLVPAGVAAALPDAFCGLSTAVWYPAWERGDLDLVEAVGAVLDCGTPSDYLRANLARSGGRDVVGAGAVVRGEIERVVVWPGATVHAGEVLVECIRAVTDDGRDLTVAAPL